MTINQEALEEVRTAVAAVRDPEYPDLNIEQLGILEDVVADAAGIRVDLIPTILGCPA
ncbi:MAG TPA: phenylacetate-CoA oxygenase subunit PaaJ, partial [Acidimicrobiaceae bacterium]|nr:phenylacetate-CoA oxygenase subunit PaaJ [Acidimicrobiaceae bacterium]